MKNSDMQFYIKELRSNECFCGRPKKPGKSFCFLCYKSLPRDMQRDLWRHIGDGYGDVYDRAVKWLEG